MLEVLLTVETPTQKTLTLNGSLTFGRTTDADVNLPDSGLSRRHATFQLQNDQVWVFDENSLNGTFVNGGAVSASGVRVYDGDRVALGGGTNISVRVRRAEESKVQSPKSKVQSPNLNAASETSTTAPQNASSVPPVLIVAGVSTFAIVGLALAALLLIPSLTTNNKPVSKTNRTPPPVSKDIPVRVVDPLKDEEVEDIDELLALWEVQEEPLDEKTVKDVRSTKSTDLNVSQAFWTAQRARARAGRGALGGGGVNVPPELASRGLLPQRKKMAELGLIGKLPRDFTEITRLRISGELVEMPLASKDYVLDQIGTSAKGGEFTLFDPTTFQKSVAAANPQAFGFLTKLAADFEGQKYNLGEADDRIEYKRRLLRSIRPETKKFIEELARPYREKFNFPLLITSLIRSLEYQYDLTQTNSNATRAPNPPHASGCTFDMAFNQMSAPEQNFIMTKLAEYERAGRIDALFEARNCIHIFVYPDGKPAK